MQNDAGDNVDLYVPRKCSYTNRIVCAKDHSSVQINVANVDPVTGMSTGDATPFCLAGYIRFKSEGDMALTELAQKNDATMFATQE
jgi:small subunit ribosomal protein S21e